MTMTPLPPKQTPAPPILVRGYVTSTSPPEVTLVGATSASSVWLAPPGLSVGACVLCATVEHGLVVVQVLGDATAAARTAQTASLSALATVPISPAGALSLTLPAGGDWLISATLDVQWTTSTGTLVVADLLVDGAARPEQTPVHNGGAGADFRMAVAPSWLVSDLASGPHTVTVRVWAAAQGVQLGAPHTRLIATPT